MKPETISEVCDNMPRYKATIYVREINRTRSFNAENEEEALKELKNFMQSALSENTILCEVKRVD